MRKNRGGTHRTMAEDIRLRCAKSAACLVLYYPGKQHISKVVEVANNWLGRGDLTMYKVCALYLGGIFKEIQRLKLMQQYNLPNAFDMSKCQSNLSVIINTPDWQPFPAFVGEDCSIFFQTETLLSAIEYFNSHATKVEQEVFARDIAIYQETLPIESMFTEFQLDFFTFPDHNLQKLSGHEKERQDELFDTLDAAYNSIFTNQCQQEGGKQKEKEKQKDLGNVRVNVVRNVSTNATVATTASTSGGAIGVAHAVSTHIVYMSKRRKVYIDEGGKYINIDSKRVYLVNIRGRYKYD